MIVVLGLGGDFDAALTSREMEVAPLNHYPSRSEILTYALRELEGDREPHPGEPTPCHICADIGGFHDEEVHAARPITEGKLLPPLEVIPTCRACGEPLSDPGLYGCRYPNHGRAV